MLSRLRNGFPADGGWPQVMFGAGIFLSLAPESGRLEKLLPGMLENPGGGGGGGSPSIWGLPCFILFY